MEAVFALGSVLKIRLSTSKLASVNVSMIIIVQLVSFGIEDYVNVSALKSSAQNAHKMARFGTQVLAAVNVSLKTVVGTTLISAIANVPLMLKIVIKGWLGTQSIWFALVCIKKMHVI